MTGNYKYLVWAGGLFCGAMFIINFFTGNDGNMWLGLGGLIGFLIGVGVGWEAHCDKVIKDKYEEQEKCREEQQRKENQGNKNEQL
jgi:hypothetical protein